MSRFKVGDIIQYTYPESSYIQGSTLYRVLEIGYRVELLDLSCGERILMMNFDETEYKLIKAAYE